MADDPKKGGPSEYIKISTEPHTKVSRVVRFLTGGRSEPHLLRDSTEIYTTGTTAPSAAKTVAVTFSHDQHNPSEPFETLAPLRPGEVGALVLEVATGGRGDKPPPPRAPPEPSPQEPSDEHSIAAAADKSVITLCEFLALLFGLPFGDALYHGTPFFEALEAHGLYLAIAVFFAAGGPMWPPLRRRFPQSRLVLTAAKAGTDARVWIYVLVAFLLISVAPEIYRRAAPPTATGAIGAMPIGSPVSGPLCYGGIPCSAFEGRPIGILRGPDIQMGTGPWGPPTNIELRVLSVSISARNLGPGETLIKNAYLVSLVTAKQLRLLVSTDGGRIIGGQTYSPIEEINAIPVNADFRLGIDFGELRGVTENEFLQDWASFALVIELEGAPPERFEFSRQEIGGKFEPAHPERLPHVTRRQQQ